VDTLTRYAWPGNIRELDNVIARAVVLSPTDTIEPTWLALTPEDAELRTHDGAHPPYFDLPYHESINAHGRFIITRALAQAGGNQTKAAEILKLQRTYLARLIKQHKTTET
jgi:DNA-binding NtrC family response regulator